MICVGMLCRNLEPESLVTKSSWKVSLASISFEGRARVSTKGASNEDAREEGRERGRGRQTSSAVLKDFLDSRVRKTQFTTSERGEKA